EKIADQIRRLKERQEALIAETARIHGQILQAKGLDHVLGQSLLDVSRGQAGLGEETASLADGKLGGAEVTARVLGKAAEAMKQAAEQMEKRVHPAKPEAAAQFDAKAAVAANERTEKLQRDALRLLEQLLDALKLDKGMGAGQVVSGGRN